MAPVGLSKTPSNKISTAATRARWRATRCSTLEPRASRVRFQTEMMALPFGSVIETCVADSHTLLAHTYVPTHAATSSHNPADVSVTRLPQHSEVSECIARISANPRPAFQTLLLMEVRPAAHRFYADGPFFASLSCHKHLFFHPSPQVHSEVLRVFDVTEVLSENPNKPEAFQRRTLKRLKSLTLRKITGQRREDQPRIIGTPTEHVRVQDFYA